MTKHDALIEKMKERFNELLTKLEHIDTLSLDEQECIRTEMRYMISYLKIMEA